jgi:hypothetical protein
LEQSPQWVTFVEQLQSLKLSSLKKRAVAAGAILEDLEAADDTDDIKAAVIELLWAAEQSSALAAADGLRDELQGLKLSVLKKRAATAGVSQQDLEAADDADDIKGTVIELVLKVSANPRAVPGPAGYGSG